MMKTIITLFLMMMVATSAFAINGWVFTPAGQSSVAVWYENDQPTDKVVIVDGSIPTGDAYIIARCKGELSKAFPSNWADIPYTIDARNSTCSYTNPNDGRRVVIKVR